MFRGSVRDTPTKKVTIEQRPQSIGRTGVPGKRGPDRINTE